MRNSESSGERAYRIIKSKIVALEFAPNSPIGEVQLAESLNVSRTPVREALQKLAAEGLVDDRSRAGSIVSPIRFEAFKVAQFIREKLEVAIIREAAVVDSKRFRFLLGQAIEEQEFAIKENDASLFFSSDEKMHQSFAIAAGYPAVWPVIAESKVHMDRMRRLSIENMDLEELFEDHIGLMNSIDEKNADLAEETMIRHLRRILQQFDELVAKFPQYFELELNKLDGAL